MREALSNICAGGTVDVSLLDGQTITLASPLFLSRDVTIQDVYEAVGANAAGKMSDADLYEMECNACPSAGSCAPYTQQNIRRSDM